MRRYWITPFTMGAFVLAGTTGVLMLLGVRTGFVTPVHEWLSLALVLGGVLHMVDHWPGIRKHLEGKWGKGFVATALVLLALAIVPWPASEHHRRSADPAQSILEMATVSQIADITGDKPESIVARLEHAGAKDISTEQSLGAIAKGSNLPIGRLLAFIQRGPGSGIDQD